MAPGPHRLTIRVDNRVVVNVGPNAHSITAHTQTNWNGIVGRIELTSGSPVWIGEVQIFPDLARRAATVRLMPPAEAVRTPVQIGFSSAFWNTAWTRNQAPHTLGLLRDPSHPALADFPTECHSNWQWWELVHGSAAMVLDGFPPGLRPLVQPIDTWFENRRLGPAHSTCKLPTTGKVSSPSGHFGNPGD